MSESKVDWSKCPDAEFFAYGEFRREYGYSRPQYWEDHNGEQSYWEESAFTLAECKEASDYEERPPQYDQSQDEKWDTGELGRDEEYVSVAELPDSLFNNAVKNTPEGAIKSNGGSSSYYDIQLPDWLIDLIVERNYSGNCFVKTEELIEVLGSDFDEGNILKCLVRINSLKKGVGKQGNDVTYDANKIIYSANRLKERDGR